MPPKTRKIPLYVFFLLVKRFLGITDEGLHKFNSMASGLTQLFAKNQKIWENTETLLGKVYLSKNSEKAFVHQNLLGRFKEAHNRKKTDLKK
jgi:hypothetical protein